MRTQEAVTVTTVYYVYGQIIRILLQWPVYYFLPVSCVASSQYIKLN
jgi:hypothetical protein